MIDVLRTNPVAARLAKGAGANALGKVWVLLAQLAAVPIMTNAWGAEGFGVWLMIATIPNFIAFSELGVGSAGAVEMTRLEAVGEHGEANIVFNTAWTFLTAVTCAVGLCAALAVGVWFTISTQSESSVFSRAEIAVSIVLTIGATLIYVQMAARRLVFQATHKYALGTLLLDFIFMMSTALVLIAVASGARLFEASAVQFVARLIGLFIYARLQRQLEPNFFLHPKAFSLEKFRALLKPSLGALSLTVANSFGLQGVVLTIGWVFGPAAAAVFATTRMLTRIPLQFSGLLARASVPELTRAQVGGKEGMVSRLMRLNLGLALSVMLPATCVLVLLGPFIMEALSHGEMQQGRLAFALLGLAACFCAVWTTLGTRLVAVNRQAEYSFVALALYGLCALTPFGAPSSITAVLCVVVFADAAIALRVATRKSGV